MRKLKNIMIFVLLVVHSSFCIAHTYDSIAYIIDCSRCVDEQIVQIEVELRGSFVGELRLNLPDVWANAEYRQQIHNIVVQNPSCSFFVDCTKRHQVVINTPELCEVLLLRYEVHQKQGDTSDVHETIIRHDLVHATGYGLFAIPQDIDREDTIACAISWSHVPDEWETCGSHGQNRTVYFEDYISMATHALYVAGAIRLYEVLGDENVTWLSLYGSFDIDDHSFASLCSRIIMGQRSFFDDTQTPYYMMSIIEGDKSGGIGGTALCNCFTGFIERGADIKRTYYMLIHEHLHNWIGGKVYSACGGRDFWWTEGCTDYYTFVFGLRLGIFSLDDGIELFNEYLRSYYLSPVLSEPNERIIKDFWNDPFVGRLPYCRGALFTLYVHHLIKQKSGSSFDDVLLDICSGPSYVRFSDHLFKNAVGKYLGCDEVELLMQQYIKEGATLDLHELSGILPLQKVSMFAAGTDEERVVYQLKSELSLQEKQSIRSFFGVLPTSAAAIP